MNMKKTIMPIIMMVLAAAMAASLESDANIEINKFFSDNGISMIVNIEASAYPVAYENHILRISKGEKSLFLDIGSFPDSKYYMDGISGELTPAEIIISAENNEPAILFRNPDKDLISIRQLSKGETYIYYGVPDNKTLSGDIKIVYITEHYEPDLKIGDGSRKAGTGRLATVSKNDPAVEINNMGLVTRGSLISIRSVLGLESFEGIQADSVKKDFVSEILGYATGLFIKMAGYIPDASYDRGYKTTGKVILSDDLATLYDVNPDQCSKIGLVFVPGYGYDFLNNSKKFTKRNAWALGIAYSRNNTFITTAEDMTLFVQKAYDLGIIPVIRVTGEDGNQINGTMVADFINNISIATQGKIKYLQIWDEPNVVNNGDLFSEPSEYAYFVKEAKEHLIDRDMKIISASLSLGKTEFVGNRTRQNSKIYMETLLESEIFMDNIDYWGSSSYNLNLSGGEYCFPAENIQFYRGSELCLGNALSYRWELELIKNMTGKDMKAFIAKAGYETPETNLENIKELIQQLKSDDNAHAVFIYSANTWKESNETAWIDEKTMELKSFAARLSGEIC